jgi:transforming growth factor-beta-induced protein
MSRSFAAASCLLPLALCAAPARAGEADIVDTAVAAGSFKTLATALRHAGLVEALKGPGPFTVFAPTDEAFAKLPKGTLESLLEPGNRATLQTILKYHVVAGRVGAAQVSGLKFAETLSGQRVDISTAGGVRVDGANVVTADIACTNGVIHVIDAVILPSTDGLLEVAGKAGAFKTLAAAIQAAGLVEALSGEGPFTVFAPTDEAFAKLPAGTLDDLLKPENKAKLAELLKLHVVSGRIYSDQALAAGRAPTLAGRSVVISAANGQATVAGSRLLTLDIEAKNGVIHVIDQVILPGATEVSRASSRACPQQEVAATGCESQSGCASTRDQAKNRAGRAVVWY